MKKQDPTVYCLQESHFRYKDTEIKSKGMEKKIYHANTNQKKPRVATLISDKANFRARKISGIKKGIT